MKSTMKKAEMAVNRTTQMGQKLADALEVNFKSSSRLHEIGPMLLRSFAHALGEEDVHWATEKDDPLKGLEPEARAVQITLAKAVAEAKEGGLGLIKESRDLEQALDRFLFTSLHPHGLTIITTAGVEGDEEEAASASVIGSFLAGCIDPGPGLIYAWSWEARLRAWIRRLVSKDQIEMDMELQDILVSLATKLQHQQEQGNAGMGRVQQASKAIRAMHSCLTSSRSVMSVKETDSLMPSFFLSIDTPHLLVSPCFGRGQDNEPELVDSDPVERIELYDAGLDHGRKWHLYHADDEGGEGICYVHESQSIQIFLASVTRQAPCILGNTPSSATALPSSRRWYIADVDKKEVYYTAQCSCQHEALPRYGWRVTVQGRAPGPRLRPVLTTTSEEAESSGHCHEEASDNRTGLPFTPATVSPEIDAVLNANANKDLDTSGGSHSSLSSSTSRRRHLVRSARVQQDKEDKPYHDLPRSPSAAPSHHNTSEATESKGKQDGPSSLIDWKSITIPVFPSIEEYFRGDSSRIETKLHRLYNDECKRLAQQEDLLKQQLKEQVQQQALNRVKDDAFRQQLEEIGRKTAAAKDEEEVKFDALLSLEATMERVLQQQEGLTSTAESELEEGDGHEEEDNKVAEENDDQDEDVDEAMDVVRQELGDYQDSPSSSPFPSRRPISGTIEVLGIESDLQQEAQQPVLFDSARVHYLIRITYVERDSQDATASCQEESKPITSSALIQHRLVVLRKQRSSFVGLHHELQNLVLQASGSGGELIIKLPEFPNISAADHGKRSSSFDVFSPFSSFTAAGGQRSVTRELCSKLEDYLNALLLCCCLGGKEEETTTTTSSTTSPSSSSACVVFAAAEKALKDFLHTSEDDDVNQGRRGGHELVVRFHTERATEVTASSRESLLKAQNYRCRGCGSALGTNFLGLDRNYMTCRYLKALFCTAYCSSGKGGEEKEKAVIPGEMIHKWDFSRRRVCRASKLFLIDIGSRPILRLSSLNQDFLGQKQVLNYVRNLRQQLSDLKLVVEKSACPTAQRLLETVLQSRPYLVLDSERFSMDDLIQLHNGLLTDTLTNLVEEMNDHVIEDCTVCKLKGCSHCALCEHTDALFPHQFWKVSQCYACSAIFHKSCLRSKTNQSTSSSSDICPICRQPRHASSSSSSSHRRRAWPSFSSSLPHSPQHHQRGVFGDLYIGDGPPLSQTPPGLLSPSFIKTTTVRAEERREEQQHGAKADDEGQEGGPLPVSFSFDL